MIRFAEIIVLCFLLPAAVTFAQPRFTPELILEYGPGINISYFDIGGGGLGLTFSASGYYRKTNNTMAGASLTYHLSKGSDEGTANAGRGYDYLSNLFVLSSKFAYLFTFKPFPEKRWKKIIMPYIFSGAGCLAFFSEPGEYPGQKTSSEYSHFAFIINGGIGINYKLNNYWGIGMEAYLNLPFSDYLEGYSPKKSEFNDIYHNLIVKIIHVIPKSRKRPLRPGDFR